MSESENLRTEFQHRRSQSWEQLEGTPLLKETLLPHDEDSMERELEMLAHNHGMRAKSTTDIGGAPSYSFQIQTGTILGIIPRWTTIFSLCYVPLASEIPKTATPSLVRQAIAILEKYRWGYW